MDRIFFAHPKSWPDERIDAFVAAIRASVPTADVISGRDDYAANIAVEGHINAWTRSVTRRRDADTGRRFYGMVVVSEERVGKATASIIGEAVVSGLPVALAELDADGERVAQVRSVIGIETVDAEDYLTGWQVVLADT